MNKLYIDQIARHMNNAKLKYQNYYDDTAMANGALEWMTGYLEKLLGNCLNVSEGKCDTWWRHEDCNSLMAILADLTGDEKYIVKPMKANSWD
jgi:hypothetical protein